jgi:hypothetical protein
MNLRLQFAAALLATTAFASTSQATTLTGTLPNGTTLQAGDQVLSPDGRLILSMQGDGNLVLYFNPWGTWSEAIWGAGTNGHPGATATMQTDGNLVIYENGEALWGAGTNPNGDHLSVQDDGNLVVYSASGTAEWGSGTNSDVPPADMCLNVGEGTYQFQFCPAGSWWETCSPAWQNGDLVQLTCQCYDLGSVYNTIDLTRTEAVVERTCINADGTLKCDN